MTAAVVARAGQSDLLRAALEYHRSWRDALRKAGVPRPKPLERGRRKRWSADVVRNVILERHRQGESLASSKVDRRLHHAACHYFGGWKKAVEAAGLDYNGVRISKASTDDAVLLDALRRIAAQHPAMTLGELWREPRSGRFARRFGSLEGAARAAGLMDWPVRIREPRRPHLSSHDTLAAIRDRARLGRPMYAGDVADDDLRLYHAALRNFETWYGALEHAGVEVPLRPVRGDLRARAPRSTLRNGRNDLVCSGATSRGPDVIARSVTLVSWLQGRPNGDSAAELRYRFKWTQKQLRELLDRLLERRQVIQVGELYLARSEEHWKAD